MTKRTVRRAPAAKPAAPSKVPPATPAPAAPATTVQHAVQLTRRQWELVQIADAAVVKASEQRSVMFNTILAGAGIAEAEVQHVGQDKHGNAFLVVRVPITAPDPGKPPAKAPRKRGK